jgi:tetratricopeptide (TPR) repeat protein
MRRLLRLIAITIVPASVPVLADDAKDCFQGKAPEIRTNGCSKIIERDPNDATAYHNRAVAREANGDNDLAIADYTKVIEIAPNNATAYENRGRAYANKGDYANATADATKANELMARATSQPSAIASKKAPRKTKTSKTAASASKATTVPKKAKGNPKASKEAPGSNLWSWLWGGIAEGGGKKGKP